VHENVRFPNVRRYNERLEIERPLANAHATRLTRPFAGKHRRTVVPAKHPKIIGMLALTLLM